MISLSERVVANRIDLDRKFFCFGVAPKIPATMHDLHEMRLLTRRQFPQDARRITGNDSCIGHWVTTAPADHAALAHRNARQNQRAIRDLGVGPDRNGLSALNGAVRQ